MNNDPNALATDVNSKLMANIVISELLVSFFQVHSNMYLKERNK